MSWFLALTLKSSRKSASLRKGDRDPRTYVWMDRKNFKRYACFKTHWHMTRRFWVVGEFVLKECCFSSWPETSWLKVQYSLRACDGGSWGWIPHCRSVGGGALHRHPCRLCWAEMWEGSGCHFVFVQQNPPSYTTGRGWLWIDLQTCNGSARL